MKNREKLYLRIKSIIMGCFFLIENIIMIYTIKLKHIALACMLGMTLTGCGSSSDSTSSVEPSDVMVERSISALI